MTRAAKAYTTPRRGFIAGLSAFAMAPLAPLMATSTIPDLCRAAAKAVAAAEAFQNDGTDLHDQEHGQLWQEAWELIGHATASQASCQDSLRAKAELLIALGSNDGGVAHLLHGLSMSIAGDMVGGAARAAGL